MTTNKILYITPYLPFPNNKAANLFISKRIEVLSEKYKIDLFSVTNGSYDTKIEEHKINKYVSSFEYINRKKVSLASILNSIIVKEPLFNILSKNAIRKIELKLQETNYDYVIVEHSYLAAMIVRYIPNVSDKIITVFHNIETDYFYDLYQKTGILNPKKYFYYLEYRGCKKVEKELYLSNAKAFWFLSDNDFTYVKNHTLNKKLLLSTTINFNLKNHDTTNKKYDLLYMGQLDNHRNLHGLKWFIDNVWNDLEEKGLRFAIAGRGDITILKNYVSNFKNIEIVGEVESLDGIFSTSKITVIPIFNTIGVQTKLFDSLAQGNIVICTEDAAKGTPFNEKEHLVVVRNASEYKDRILEVLDKPQNFEYLYENLETIQEVFKKENLLEDMKRSLNEK